MDKNSNESKPFKFKPGYSLGILGYPLLTSLYGVPSLNNTTVNPFVPFHLFSAVMCGHTNTEDNKDIVELPVASALMEPPGSYDSDSFSSDGSVSSLESLSTEEDVDDEDIIVTNESNPSTEPEKESEDDWVIIHNSPFKRNEYHKQKCQ